MASNVWGLGLVEYLVYYLTLEITIGTELILGFGVLPNGECLIRAEQHARIIHEGVRRSAAAML